MAADETGNQYPVHQPAYRGKQDAGQHGKPDRPASLHQQSESDSGKAQHDAARQVDAFGQNDHRGANCQDQQSRSLPADVDQVAERKEAGGKISVEDDQRQNDPDDRRNGDELEAKGTLHRAPPAPISFASPESPTCAVEFTAADTPSITEATSSWVASSWLNFPLISPWYIT